MAHREVISYGRDVVKIDCEDDTCDHCQQLSPFLKCKLYKGSTNFVPGEKDTAYRLSVCRATEAMRKEGKTWH